MSWRDTSNLFIVINSPDPDIVAAEISPSGVISGPTGEGDMGEGDEQAHQLKGLLGYVYHLRRSAWERCSHKKAGLTRRFWRINRNRTRIIPLRDPSRNRRNMARS